MILFKVIILLGVLTLALGSNGGGQKRAKHVIAKRKQNDQSYTNAPYALNLQQKAYIFKTITDEAITGLTNDRNEEIRTNANTNKEVIKVRPKQVNTKKLENAAKKTISGAENKVANTKKLNKQLSNLGETASDVLRMMDEVKKMKKAKDKKEEKCESCMDYIDNHMGGYDPLLSFTYIILAYIMNRLRGIIDKYGLDKESTQQENANK